MLELDEGDSQELDAGDTEEVVVEAGNASETVATALCSDNVSPHSGGSTNRKTWQPTLDAEIDETWKIKTTFPDKRFPGAIGRLMTVAP